MAETTLSPTPVDGGTFRAPSYGDVVYMGNNKWFGIQSQTNPDHTIGTLWQVTGADTATPTVTVLRNQILSDYGVSGTSWFKIAKLNDNQVLVIRVLEGTAGSAHVINIDPSTYVMTTVNSNTPTWSDSYSQNYRTGMISAGVDNIAFASRFTGGTASVIARMDSSAVDRFDWDLATNTLTHNSGYIQSRFLYFCWATHV